MTKELLQYLDLLAEDYVITDNDREAIKQASDGKARPSDEDLVSWNSILADEIWYNKGIIKIIDAKLPVCDDNIFLEEMLKAREEIQAKVDSYEQLQILLPSLQA